MSRMSQDRLWELTGRRYGKAQVRWFAEFLGAEVPSDQKGPIVTEQAFEALVARAAGISAANESERPRVKLRKRA